MFHSVDQGMVDAGNIGVIDKITAASSNNTKGLADLERCQVAWMEVDEGVER